MQRYEVKDVARTFPVEQAWRWVGKKVEFIGYYPGVPNGTRAQITDVTLANFGYAIVAEFNVGEGACKVAIAKDEAGRYLRPVEE